MTQPPEIAVVCSTFRRSRGLPRLFGALEDQDLDRGRFEVVIVDNGSHDDTAEVLARIAASSSLQIRVLEMEVNQGPAAARNRGWRTSSTPYVAFIDDDCLPQAGWLRAGLAAISDEAIGVVQGRTEPGEGPVGDWTLQRVVRSATPFFEGANIFYRREALEAAGGFDERIGWYGEDTALGWSVVDLGFGRGYADDAVVIHPLEDRPFRWHVRTAFLEGNMVPIARRHPGFADEAFHNPWSFHPHDLRTVVALVGIVLASRSPWTLVLAYPWYRMRKARPTGDHPLRLLGERAVVDSASVVGLLLASVRERHFVI